CQTPTVWRQRWPLLDFVRRRESRFGARRIAHPESRGAEAAANEEDAAVRSNRGLSVKVRRRSDSLGLRVGWLRNGGGRRSSSARDSDSPEIEIARAIG